MFRVYFDNQSPMFDCVYYSPETDTKRKMCMIFSGASLCLASDRNSRIQKIKIFNSNTTGDTYTSISVYV